MEKWIEVRPNDWTYKLKCPHCGFEYAPERYEDGTTDEPYKLCSKCGERLEKPD